MEAFEDITQRITARRHTLGLPLIPNVVRGDMDTVADLEALNKQLLEACREANTEIIAALEIPTDKRLEKDEDNLIYVIRDILARAFIGQQILKAAIEAADKKLGGK